MGTEIRHKTRAAGWGLKFVITFAVQCVHEIEPIFSALVGTVRTRHVATIERFRVVGGTLDTRGDPCASDAYLEP